MATNATNAQTHRRSRRPGQVDTLTAITPDGISGLVGWWRADAFGGKADGDALQSWPDVSGNNKDFISTVTDSTNPVYKTGRVNGYPAVRFDATNDVLPGTLTVTNPFSLFIVYAWMGSGGARRVLAGSGGNNWLIGPRSDTGNNYKYYNGAFILGPALSSGTWVYETVTQDSGGAVFRHGGTQQGTNTNTTTPGLIYMGMGGTFAEPAGSDVAECFIYNRVLTAAEIATAELYIKNKYAL